MRIELLPDPGVDDPVARAVAAALGHLGPGEGESGSGPGGAWRRAGLEEAVARGAPSNDSVGGSHTSAAMALRYVPSVRKSRGATRA
jgi:hypothetical protein